MTKLLKEVDEFLDITLSIEEKTKIAPLKIASQWESFHADCCGLFV